MLKLNFLRAAAVALILAPASALAGTTQIIVQWVDSDRGLSAEQVFMLQGVFDDNAGRGGYASDGNDVGGGVENFYLYVDDARVDAAIQAVVDMQKRKLLPGGMRIGVAVYKDAARKDWNYRPAYPAALKKFDITYPAQH